MYAALGRYTFSFHTKSTSDMNEKRTDQRLLFVSLLFMLLFNYPILSVFNTRKLLGGVPVLYCYIFGLWCLLIFLIYRISSDIFPPHDNQNHE